MFWLCTSDHSLGPAVSKLEMSATSLLGASSLLFGIAAPACWPDLFWRDVLSAQICDISEILRSLVQPSSKSVPCWSFIHMVTSWQIPSGDKRWLKGPWEWVLGQVRAQVMFSSSLLGGERTQLGALGRPMPGCVADVQLRLMSWKPACWRTEKMKQKWLERNEILVIGLVKLLGNALNSVCCKAHEQKKKELQMKEANNVEGCTWAFLLRSRCVFRAFS